MRNTKVYVVLFLLIGTLSLSGQEIKDRPKDGEGIYAF